MVKCSDEGVDDHFGIGYLPRLVYFDKGIPEMFSGAEVNEAEVLGWISNQLKSNVIHLVTRAVAEMMILKNDHVGLIFIDDEDADGLDIVDELEKDMFTINDEELMIQSLQKNLALTYHLLFTSQKRYPMFIKEVWK